VLLEVLGLANKYGFVELQSAMSEYLKAVLDIRNVCLIFDIASMYGLRSLCETCCQFMDHNAAEILQSEGFLSLSPVPSSVSGSLWSTKLFLVAWWAVDWTYSLMVVSSIPIRRG